MIIDNETVQISTSGFVSTLPSCCSAAFRGLQQYYDSSWGFQNDKIGVLLGVGGIDEKHFRSQT